MFSEFCKTTRSRRPRDVYGHSLSSVFRLRLVFVSSASRLPVACVSSSSRFCLVCVSSASRPRLVRVSPASRPRLVRISSASRPRLVSWKMLWNSLWNPAGKYCEVQLEKMKSNWKMLWNPVGTCYEIHLENVVKSDPAEPTWNNNINHTTHLASAWPSKVGKCLDNTSQRQHNGAQTSVVLTAQHCQPQHAGAQLEEECAICLPFVCSLINLFIPWLIRNSVINSEFGAKNQKKKKNVPLYTRRRIVQRHRGTEGHCACQRQAHRSPTL